MALDDSLNLVAPADELDRGGSLLPAMIGYLGNDDATNSNLLAPLCGQPTFPANEIWLVALRNNAVVAVGRSADQGHAFVSRSDDATAVFALGARAANEGWHIRRVLAPTRAGVDFAHGWVSETGDRMRLVSLQRMLIATNVSCSRAVQGSWRPRSGADTPLLCEWFAGFVVEAEHAPASVAAQLGRAMAEGSPDGVIWLAPDGLPSSVAISRMPTPRGMRIGPVYTPPEYRRHGYAAAVTAAATRVLLEHSAEFVCLYADAANVTANRIYASIGYRWISDSAIWHFDAGIVESS